MRRFSFLALALRKRTLGLAGGRRRRPFVLGAIASLAALGAFLVSNALAVHDTGRFQLDGNALSSEQSTPEAKDDWDKVCHQVKGEDCSITENTTGATAVSWEAEPNLSSTIFTGGGSKDPQDISQWLWKDEAGGLPDKDNLLHSFAARYSLPNDPVDTKENGDTNGTACPAGKEPTCQLLVFGSDRYDNSGDAQQGFWFFQNKITTGGTATKGGTKFTGLHKNGDLLVISDFSNGGTTSTITVYKWDTECTKGVTSPKPGECGDTNLRLLETSEAANCASAAIGDEFCGIVNTKTVPSPWSFEDKSGTVNKFLNGEFYEGGINLSKLGLGGECFATVASETRSSTSTTATLKDFILSKFGECSSKVETTPVSGLNKNNEPNPIPSTGLNIPTDPNEASLEVEDLAKITVGGSSSFSANVSFHLCGPFGASTTTLCSTGGVNVGEKSVTTSGTVLSEPAKVTEAGRYCWRADFSGDETKGVPKSSDSSSTECFKVNPATPEITTEAGEGPVDFGEPVTDTASLKGTAHKPGTGGPEGSTDESINPKTFGGDAKGTITFTLYKLVEGKACSELVKATSNNAEEKNPQTVEVTGDGTEYKASFTPNEPGKYVWVAKYSGDSPNTNEAGPSSCTDAKEQVEVNQIPTAVKTKQSWIPQDTAAISATSGNLGTGGKVTFSLYNNATCSTENEGKLLFQQSVEVNDGKETEELSTSNSGVNTSEAGKPPNGVTITSGYEEEGTKGPYSWKVVYTPSSTDTAHTGSESACDVEHFSIPYTNGPVPAGAAAATSLVGAAPTTSATVAAGAQQHYKHRNRRRHRRLRHHLRVHR
jgi:hypothetical protein